MEENIDYYNNDSLENNKDSVKLDKKFNDYMSKFNNKYIQIKSSLSEIQDNIINYNSEVNKLDDFLNEINEHEKNYREIINKFNKLAEYLQETITIEKVIHQLASNPQVINMSEYISIYNKVKEIYKQQSNNIFHMSKTRSFTNYRSSINLDPIFKSRSNI